ncbi:hypothetical protein GGI25_002415 [Coemansia spiralis]|uniref:RING-type domain-containing protein n=2 Tax=Coemansia TaxID=4863 RepID=A0A9W8KYK8_9FUNG|nr:hypothetical protein BX070DRAFT_220497 [Coemansia spiralis]KAJ1991281.1 hypothetical protein EDC05_003500 [Coemansia umbellata]KAJ2619569.1 hypothetical protein GGI26_005730 [Coemansia sp. RSA 1358]KAJ2678430.1 hypothetical protein GGI25_002415 [Coemansia spiralis]
MARLLLVDTAYAVFSTAMLALLFTGAGPKRSLEEFRRKCELEIAPQTQLGNADTIAYRDSLTIKYYSSVLWCNVSWTLGVLLSNKWHMLGLANALVAVVSLARKALIQFIFGRLTLHEVHHSYDRILNFVLFKVVSVRATLDADWEDLAIWTVVYCCFGALYLVGGLARDHLECLRLSPAQSGARWGFVGLLVVLMTSAVGMGVLCWVFLRPLFVILCIEALTIMFDVGQTLVRYTAYTWGTDSTETWEARSDAVVVCEFITDMCILVLTLLHYTHILFINGLTLNIVSALVFFNIRSITSKLYRKTRKLVAFRRAVASMKCRFPDASKEEIIKFNDRCSICREMLVTAKKLPCEHLFHRSCLRSWLVRHLSCPTCRATLSGADVGPWASTNPAMDMPEHGSDLVFAAANSG